MSKHWIQDAVSKPGSLRAETHTKAGHKIPMSVLEKDAKKPGKLGKRARLAEEFRSFHHRVHNYIKQNYVEKK